jgi:hypothetical protein
MADFEYSTPTVHFTPEREKILPHPGGVSRSLRHCILPGVGRAPMEIPPTKKHPASCEEGRVFGKFSWTGCYQPPPPPPPL